MDASDYWGVGTMAIWRVYGVIKKCGGGGVGGLSVPFMLTSKFVVTCYYIYICVLYRVISYLAEFPTAVDSRGDKDLG